MGLSIGMGGGITRKGLLFVVSSPSGAGKTTLGRLLQESEEDLEISVSVTTRPARPSEIDGKDYIFLTPDQFNKMRDEGALLESAEVFGHNYGTPRQSVEDNLARGRDVLFDVDWQGRQQLADAMSEDVVSVFILPPSARELSRRLASRGQDKAETRGQRMKYAPREISHYAEYDYIVVNYDLAESLTQLRAILHAERMRRARQTGLRQLVDELTAELQSI